MSVVVAVTGGRAYNDGKVVWDALSALQTERGIARIIHGSATGADAHAHGWAISHGVPVIAYPADWKVSGRKAGPLRNERMLSESRPHILLAFPGGRGTRDCVRRAQAKGVDVRFPVQGDACSR